MADPKSLRDLFVQKLKYIYDAEQRLVKTLPKLADAASAPDLKQAFESHLRQTETHVDRVEQLFGLFDQKPDADGNPNIKGIISAGSDMMDLNADPPVRDAALIAAAQVAEHYEIAEYGTLKAWARVLGKTEAIQLIDWTLEDEKNADQTLTQAATRLNFQAAAPHVR
jgi:ferritin-like metal-binding protein YciE